MAYVGEDSPTDSPRQRPRVLPKVPPLSPTVAGEGDGEACEASVSPGSRRTRSQSEDQQETAELFHVDDIPTYMTEADRQFQRVRIDEMDGTESEDVNMGAVRRSASHLRGSLSLSRSRARAVAT